MTRHDAISGAYEEKARQLFRRARAKVINARRMRERGARTVVIKDLLYDARMDNRNARRLRDHARRYRAEAAGL